MFKNVIALAAALLCGAASATTTSLELSKDGSGQWSASFSATASGNNSFTLDLSSLGAGWSNFSLSSLIVTANFSGNRGYDVTAVTLDGHTLTPTVNVSYPGLFGADVWTQGQQSLSAGLHTLAVSGDLVGGNVGFTGSLSITAQPVPEPESYALMLAGLGCIALAARRRLGR
ncbi:FxDxF family PEP-CTERM protein [Roseateles sp. BYS78W]|uniref:FxDxF family PEP-CTERM protein n=1 Tax=Pelomonas candidula TaxID=3299025 RepID=A0ABW7H7C6_9BURK